MGTNLVLYENNQQIEISSDDIRKYIAPDLTEKEFWMFIQTARTFGLNPLKREIYAIKYGDKFSVITGYQVYLQRIIQADILEYWGVEIEKPDPKNADTWIGVFTAKRKDWAKEFVWKVPMIEANKKQALWNTQKEFQLKKTTISQGCRMLAPDIVAGIPYTNEELGVEEESQFETKANTQEDRESERSEKPKPDPKAQKTFADDKESTDIIAENTKTQYLHVLANTLDKFTTTAKIDEFYNKNSKIYKTSAFFEEIKKVYLERKQDLAYTIMATNMGVDVQDLIAFRVAVNGDGIDKSLIEQILADNKEACKELKTRIENWKIARDAKIDAEASEIEETDLDALGNGEQELNANNS